MTMAYDAQYSVDDISDMVVDVFGTALEATITWIDLLVLLAVVGIVLSIIMGILFKVSRILGLG
jgi:hypothetical protein